MALILEDGTGVSGANAYTTASAVTAYLSERNRTPENGWDGLSGSEKNAAVIAATDYIETRFSLRFLGQREWQNVSVARGTLTFTDQPANAETIVLDGTTYTFNTALGGANSVLIGASVAARILNLVNAVTATATEAGVTHGTGTVAHTTVSVAEAIGDRLLAIAVIKGTAGNIIVTTTTVALASWSAATLLGGSDVAEPQPLSFPRIHLFDREGLSVRGMPTKLLHATAEYAVRTSDGTKLAPDPVTDTSGQLVTGKSTKIGPIETSVQYSDSGALLQVSKPYPAADRLLAGYISQGGRVIRG